MKYHIESLGCAKNLVDSERFAAILVNSGFTEAESWDSADLVLVNSCAFLSSALGELDDILCEILDDNRKRKFRLVVTGCVMNRAYDEFKDLFPEVNHWVPLKDFADFEAYLHRYVLADKQLKPSIADSRIALQTGQHVYLRIADGCENHCTYCMIPSIRGKLVSVPIEDLVKEAKSLAKRGKELVLIAQDTCMYGVDIYGEKALPKLIEALCEISEFHWIRIMYLHPDHFETDWLYLWEKHPKLLPYFEIPIQHASNRILKLMNRKKGYRELRDLFRTIMDEVPNAVFRTTVMVGFPSETTEDRAMIIRFFKEIDILHAGVFGYSPEEGSPAFQMPSTLSHPEIKTLEIELAMKIARKKERKMQKFVGSTQEAIIEGYDPELKAYVGRTWFQAPEIDGVVYVEARKCKEIENVEIVHALGNEMWSHLKKLKIR